MSKGDTAKRIAMLLAGCLFVYVASIGPVLVLVDVRLARHGLTPTADSEVVTADEEIFRRDYIPRIYSPIFWINSKSPWCKEVYWAYYDVCWNMLGDDALLMPKW